MATARLTSPTGSTVSVDSAKVDELKRRGFVPVSDSSDKAPAKKSASSKSEK